MPTINWLAILLAALIRMAVGTAWYSPLLFVKPWQALTGVTPASMKAGMSRAIFIDAVMSLLMAFVFYYVLHTGTRGRHRVAVCCWACSSGSASCWRPRCPVGVRKPAAEADRHQRRT